MPTGGQVTEASENGCLVQAMEEDLLRRVRLMVGRRTLEPTDNSAACYLD
jgi:hypothetical protein